MQIKVLGCSGGIGGELRTTSMLVDDDILIDAGTGVGDLSIEELIKIDHVFLTHAHLDHIAFLPLLLDTVMGMRFHPITVHANAETIEVLKTHIFNWKVWPDFNAIPDSTNAILNYNAITVGEPVTINDRHFTALPANHVVPAVGYSIDSGEAALAFTGDTTICSALWPTLNAIKNLRYLLIEAAFSNNEDELAKLSKHLCPSMLLSELNRLEQQGAEIYITHLKPCENNLIMSEIQENSSGFKIKELKASDIFLF